MRTCDYRTGAHRWQRLFVGVVICSLMVGVATRFCATTAFRAHTVKTVENRSAEPKRQNLDCDAIQWVAPARVAIFLERATLYPRVVVADTVLPNHVVDESLYNRPPPPAQSSL